MSRPAVAIVTGANRGIGEAIAQALSSGSYGPLVLYATSRQGSNMGFKVSPGVSVIYPELDIANAESIQNFASSIKRDCSAVSVLINNAGVNLDDQYSPETVKTTLDTNVRGTLRMCEAFLPLLTKDGRIVNVSSTGSSLNQYSKENQAAFRSSVMTLDDLEKMMQKYQASASSGTETQAGWPQHSYSVSKACINALTAVLARKYPGLVINACCPGWVSTDMGKMVGSTPPKSSMDGAKIPLRLGFGKIDGVTGRYWGNPSIAGTGDGQVMEW